jgi:hypothetical protein
MRQNDTADAKTARPPEAGPAARRRQFLKGLTIPPTAAALAGCSRVDVGGDASDPIVENLEPGDVTGFPGAIRFGDRYAIDITHGGDGTKTLSGRFHNEDRVLEFADGGDGTTMTSYIVDGDGYVVTAGECIEYPSLTTGFESIAKIGDGDASDAAEAPQLSITGQTTIDGRTMLMFEPEQGEPVEDDLELTYYADEGTRYLRRIETGATTVEYHSWNAVEPIEMPDMNCRQND